MTPILRLQAILKAVSPSKRTMIVPSSAKQHIAFTTMAPAPASAPASASSPTAAPWRAKLLSDVDKMDQPSFTFTSLHPSASSAPTPRGRTCIFRGLWATLPHNDKNKAPRNPPVYESDLPVLTTDARMDKVPEIFASGEAAQEISRSGGGGPVEAMFWAASTGTQWRIRGRAWVLAPGDIDSSSAGAEAAKEALRARMRDAGSSGSGAEWSWEKEIVGHFGNLSPGMRGSFKNPSPGTPRASKPGPGEGLGQKVGDELLEDEVARKNFRVVVIVPDEVDLCDLSDAADPRRWLYSFVGTGAKATRPGGEIEGEWEKVEVWP